jgi:serine/threonine protein kinase
MLLGHQASSDVWAIGCMLYAMLCGAPPFETQAWGEYCFLHYQCCGSGMFIPDLNFSIPGPGSRVEDPGPRIQGSKRSRIRVRIKKYLVRYRYLYLTHKTVTKLLEILYEIFLPHLEFFSIPDPGSRFFSILIPIFLYPGSRGQKSTRSRIRICNIDQFGDGRLNVFFLLLQWGWEDYIA